MTYQNMTSPLDPLPTPTQAGKTAENAISGHYSRLSLQPWDAMKAWMPSEQYTGYLLGNVIKYVGRFNVQATGKGGLPDLMKARHYLERLIEWEGRE